MYTQRNLRRSSATQFVDETTGLIPANDSIFTLHINYICLNNLLFI